jgi:hypothetical protein
MYISQPKYKLILGMLKINSICYFNPLSQYFVSAGLSPNPSPEVGGALNPKHDLPPLTSGEGERGGEAGKSK